MGYFGESVAGLGDVNGDGFADVAVGAPGFDQSYRGAVVVSRVFVYFGGVAPHALPDLVLQGEKLTEEFGKVVVPAGDVDHDGYADFAVLAPGVGPLDLAGTPNAIPMWPGKVYLYSGGPNAGQSIIATMTAGTTFPLIGSLAMLDVDGDAEAEILASEWDFNASTGGHVNIYRASDGYTRPARTLPTAPSYGGYCDANISR